MEVHLQRTEKGTTAASYPYPQLNWHEHIWPCYQHTILLCGHIPRKKILSCGCMARVSMAAAKRKTLWQRILGMYHSKRLCLKSLCLFKNMTTGTKNTDFDRTGLDKGKAEHMDSSLTGIHPEKDLLLCKKRSKPRVPTIQEHNISSQSRDSHNWLAL